MRPWSLLLITALAASLAACGKPAEQATAPPAADAAAEAAIKVAAEATAAAGPLEQPELTIKDMMDQSIDPSGDYLFESVQDIATEKGASRKEPKTDAEWAEVRQHFQILHDAPRLLIQAGRKAGRPEDKPEHPEVENSPEQVQQLIDSERSKWVIRAQAMQTVAADGIKAAEAKDVTALSATLLKLDHACEACHLRFFYPRDQRAHQAAKEEGLTDY
jgi:hypothetical protein